MKNILNKNDLIIKIGNFKQNLKYKDLTFPFLSLLYHSYNFYLTSSEVIYINSLFNHKNFEKNFEELNTIFVSYSDIPTFKYLKNRNVNFIYKYYKKTNINKSKIIKFIKFFNNNIWTYFQSKNNENISDIKILKPLDNNNILDFVTNIVLKNHISEEDMLHFCNISKSEIFISYIEEYSLSLFINICFSLIYKIKKNEVLKVNSKEIPKQSYFYSHLIQFIKKINDDLFVSAYQYTGYLNITLDSKIKDKIDLKDQTNSHYIQGAYLKRIMGDNIFIESKEIYINPKNTNIENPYCKYYFYGNSIPQNSIEKKLSNIENDYLLYLDNLEQIIYGNKSKQTYYSNKNINFHQEHNLIFILNYIRTGNFLDDIRDGYIKFCKRYKQYTATTYPNNITEQRYYGNYMSDQFTKNTTHIQSFKFFKIFQTQLLSFLLDIISNNIRIEKSFIDDFITKYLTNNPIISGDFVSNDKNWCFIIMTLNKIKEFIFDKTYNIRILQINFNKFSYNLFIPRVSNFHQENHNFSNEKSIIMGYYPINKNSLILFHQDKIEINDIYEDNPIDITIYQDDMMINLNHLPFIISIE